MATGAQTWLGSISTRHLSKVPAPGEHLVPKLIEAPHQARSEQLVEVAARRGSQDIQAVLDRRQTNGLEDGAALLCLENPGQDRFSISERTKE